MHAMAKTAGKGLEKVSTVARRGMTHVGRGLSRVGLRTQRFGRKLAGVGVAAARGLARVGQSYRRNAIQARTSLGHRIYAAGEGISFRTARGERTGRRSSTNAKALLGSWRHRSSGQRHMVEPKRSFHSVSNTTSTRAVGHCSRLPRGLSFN